MTGQRFGDRPGHRSKRRLMQDVIDPRDRRCAGITIADIGLDELERSPVSLAHLRANVVQIAAMTSREIIESTHLLAGPQQRFDQMRTNETGRARDQPMRRSGGQGVLEIHRHEGGLAEDSFKVN